MYKIDDNAPTLDLKGKNVAEISSEWYYNIFNAVPPLDYGVDWFICGEPYSTDGRGHFTYQHFFMYDGKYYVFRDMRPTSRHTLAMILIKELNK